MVALTPGSVSYGTMDCEEPITETNFRAKEDLQEGISGRRSLDSSYENTHLTYEVNAPRSQGNPVPEELDEKTKMYNKTGKPWS